MILHLILDLTYTNTTVFYLITFISTMWLDGKELETSS